MFSLIVTPIECFGIGVGDLIIFSLNNWQRRGEVVDIRDRYHLIVEDAWDKLHLISVYNIVETCGW